MSLVVGIDAGTQCVKLVVYDPADRHVSVTHGHVLELIAGDGGSREQHPERWIEATRACIAKLDPALRARVAAIGMSASSMVLSHWTLSARSCAHRQRGLEVAHALLTQSPWEQRRKERYASFDNSIAGIGKDYSGHPSDLRKAASARMRSPRKGTSICANIHPVLLIATPCLQPSNQHRGRYGYSGCRR